MPYINIRLGSNLDQEQRNLLYEKTTSLMNTVMRKRPEVAVVHIQESESQQWSVNSIPIAAKDPVSAYVNIKVTDGTNTQSEKAEMISQTVKMLQDVVGIIQKACYVVIDDIPADSWGYNGKTQAARAASKL
jgi:4-oxalocrotonate tautomerase